MPGGKRLDFSLVLVLFVAGLMLRFLLLAPFEFDGLYGQDSYAYYNFAQELRRVFSEGHSPRPLFWPLGYPILLAAGFSLFGAQAKIGQIMNVLLGASLAPGVYVLARQMGGRRAGALAAGVVMAVCGQALQSSLVLMADIPALAWAIFSGIALWGYLRDGSRRWLVIAAALLALASVMRWLYLVLVFPWSMALMLTKPVRWRDVAVAALSAGGILIAQLIYSRNSPFNHAWLQGWSIENLFRNEFVNVDGHFRYELQNWRFYAQPFYDAYYIAPVFAPFLVIGLAALFRRSRRTSWVMLAGWALLPYAFLAGIPYQNVRFPLIVFPSVAILTGVGLEALLYWFERKHKLAFLRWPVVAVIVILGSRETLVTAWPQIDTFIANQQRDKQAAQWVVEHVPEQATLYTFGLTLTLKHYTTLDVYEIYYESPETLAERWKTGQDDYLLLNVWNVENQWAGREPYIAYHWLRDRRGLVEIGRYGNYTLFRIEG